MEQAAKESACARTTVRVTLLLVHAYVLQVGEVCGAKDLVLTEDMEVSAPVSATVRHQVFFFSNLYGCFHLFFCITLLLLSFQQDILRSRHF